MTVPSSEPGRSNMVRAHGAAIGLRLLIGTAVVVAGLLEIGWRRRRSSRCRSWKSPKVVANDQARVFALVEEAEWGAAAGKGRMDLRGEPARLEHAVAGAVGDVDQVGEAPASWRALSAMTICAASWTWSSWA